MFVYVYLCIRQKDDIRCETDILGLATDTSEKFAKNQLRGCVPEEEEQRWKKHLDNKSMDRQAYFWNVIKG